MPRTNVGRGTRAGDHRWFILVRFAFAVLAILSGLGGARAEELRLNQQSLEQRIDQLAAGGLEPGAGALFSINRNSATGQPVGEGSYRRSILIPGTETSVKIYGVISEVLDYWLTGGNPNGLQTTTVGVNGTLTGAPLRNTLAAARGNGVFSQSPRESRLGVETRTPTPFGEARTVMEFDWAGSNAFIPGGANPTSVSDNLVPRLRYAYGTLGGFLAGQATSNFSDPDANSETIDFGGNVGDPGHVRVPQIRYTMPAWWDSSFSVSAETPETTIFTPIGPSFGSDAGVIPAITTSCTAGAPVLLTPPVCTSVLLVSGVTPVNIAKASAPDLTAAWYFGRPWGHIDFSAVLRPGLEASDGKFFAKRFIGYGGHVGFDVSPGWFGWVRDNFTLQVEGGDMIGPFINDNRNYDLATNYGVPATGTSPGTYGGVNGPTSAASAAAIIFKPTHGWGGTIGYQHWWTDNLRSNVNGGIGTLHGTPVSLVGAGAAAGANKQAISAHANLIWNPLSSVTIGVEYVWGRRTVLNNSFGTMNTLIGRFALSF